MHGKISDRHESMASGNPKRNYFCWWRHFDFSKLPLLSGAWLGARCGAAGVNHEAHRLPNPHLKLGLSDPLWAVLLPMPFKKEKRGWISQAFTPHFKSFPPVDIQETQGLRESQRQSPALDCIEVGRVVSDGWSRWCCTNEGGHRH